MTGKYLSLTCESEFEVFWGIKMEGKRKERVLLCQRTKCKVEGATLNDPYPIEEKYIDRLLKFKSWKKISEN